MTTTVTMTGPGTTTVVNDAAAAIAAQTTQLALQLNLINAAINQINNNMSALVAQSALQSKALSDLSVAVATVSAATSNQTVLQAAAVSNQIQTNNFQVQATKDALTRTGQPLPVLPSMQDQLVTTITDGVALQGAAVAQGAISNFITQQAVAVQSWIVGTEVYKTVAAYATKAKNALLSILPPPTVSAITSNAKAMAGDPSISNFG